MKNRVYTFLFIRVGRKDVEAGPFLTTKEAKEIKALLVKMKAKCSRVYPVKCNPERLKLLKDKKGKDLIKRYVDEFRAYLEAELEVLELVNAYDIIYSYISELEKRVMRHVKEHSQKLKKDSKKNLPKEFIKSLASERIEQLTRIAWVLKERSRNFPPGDSVPEYIGKSLKGLARKVLQII